MSVGLPIELRERIVRAHVEQGMGPQEIAEVFGVARTSVRRYLEKHANGESLAVGRPPGARAKLGPAEHAWIGDSLKQDPYLTSYELAARYNRQFKANRVHRSTILRAMRTLGFTHKKRPR